MRFDRSKFYDGLRQWRGPLTRQQVGGINFILDAMESDPFLRRVEHAAYMLATVKHETADTYQPIHEYGSKAYFIRRYGSQTRVGKRLGNDTPEEGAIYAGRGDVQLTGEDNYEKAEAALRKQYPEIVADFEARTGRKFDLTVGDQADDHNDPENASDPAIAYAIMSYGMRTGLFTTLNLSHYTTSNGFDPLKARAIINGTDKAELIASYYRRFLPILRASLMDATEDDILEIRPERAAELAAASSTGVSGHALTGDAADETTSHEPASIEQPPAFVPETKTVDAPEPTGFMGKLKAQGAALLAFIGGGAGLKEFFGVQISPETVDLLKILVPTVLGLGFIGFLVWFVSEKIVGFKTLKLKADYATDPKRHDLEINAK